MEVLTYLGKTMKKEKQKSSQLDLFMSKMPHAVEENFIDPNLRFIEGGQGVKDYVFDIESLEGVVFLKVDSPIKNTEKTKVLYIKKPTLSPFDIRLVYLPLEEKSIITKIDSQGKSLATIIFSAHVFSSIRICDESGRVCDEVYMKDNHYCKCNNPEVSYFTQMSLENVYEFKKYNKLFCTVDETLIENPKEKIATQDVLLGSDGNTIPTSEISCLDGDYDVDMDDIIIENFMIPKK